ncbi:MAG: SAM-dependent methyltransferase [Nitrospirota bacterium]|nr:SAM-dependent methyltransferase [Nitrospirota bacterium]
MLKRIISERIKQGGSITFERFMDMALYQPEYGYYMSVESVIGPDGDFFTSPHLHPVFGWLLAIQIDEMRRLLGEPKEFTILEIGAGRGFLAEGIISYIRREFNWGDRWHYIIVERNPHMRQGQEETLSKYKGIVQWVSSLSDVERFCGCVVSNELLDAFPAHVVQMNDTFSEVYVDVAEDGFKESMGALSTPLLEEYIRRYRIPGITGYRTEVNLRLRGFLEEINNLLSEGFVITIDYGYPSWEYYAEERSRGTLLCYHRHTCNEDPYGYIGEQDITAHVNFSALRDWGEDVGMRTIGYCPQGTFLVSLGIDRVISGMLSADPGFQSEIPKIKGLLLGMGDTHKVMVQYKGNRKSGSLRGFELRNRLNLL